MTYLTRSAALAAVATLLTAPGCGPSESARAAPETGPAPVERIKTPNNGIQPQAVTDARGGIHLVYFTGPPANGDLFYTRRAPGQSDWSAPLRVNSEPGTAVAMGTIRGGQLSLGKGDRAHVVWFGSSKASQKGPHGSAPLLYTRLNDDDTAFEPQRNLMRKTTGLDGGPSVAADGNGGVFVAWQAAPAPKAGEAARRLWVARSMDEGRSFTAEEPAYDQPTGACPCCSTKVFADSRGTLYVLYRTAQGRVNRDMLLLTSQDAGKSFRSTPLDPWPVDT